MLRPQKDFMIFSPKSIKICVWICIGVPMVFGMFRGDFGDFIPPRRPTLKYYTLVHHVRQALTSNGVWFACISVINMVYAHPGDWHAGTSHLFIFLIFFTRKKPLDDTAKVPRGIALPQTTSKMAKQVGYTMELTPQGMYSGISGVFSSRTCGSRNAGHKIALYFAKSHATISDPFNNSKSRTSSPKVKCCPGWHLVINLIHVLAVNIRHRSSKAFDKNATLASADCLWIWASRHQTSHK